MTNYIKYYTENVVAIHQPNYIPWLGYFYKIHQSDVFVFLDDVQYSNQGMHNYHYIKTPQGPFRLKIPVKQKHGDWINQVCTRDELNWKTKHLKTIEMNYRKSQYFEEVFTEFKAILDKTYLNIAVMNAEIIKWICKKFNFAVKFINSSDLQMQTSKEQKIFDICRQLKATTYYSGTGAKAYQVDDEFLANGLNLKYSIFSPVPYFQLWGEFQPNVTILDYLMNRGYDWDWVVESQKVI